MQALRLTNAQIKARSKPNLNARLAEALRVAGYAVITFAEWQQWVPSVRFTANPRPFFVAEFPFAPARPTWDYRKTIAPFEAKARWQFSQVSAPRRWRIDFAWPITGSSGGLAIEVDGGTYSGGGHVRGSFITLDCLKRAEMEIDGWTLIRVDGTMVRHQVAIEIIQRAVRARQAG